jgi:hypothetical protein
VGGTGSSGAQFLQIGGGTKALGMGSAFVAYAEGLDAIYWNPAGLSFNKDQNFSVTHLNYFAEMSYDNVAYSRPLGEGTIGISAIGLFSGDIEITTTGQQEGTGETYRADEFAIGISYGSSLTEKFSVGATFKFIHMGLADLSARGWAMDIGAIYKTGLLNNLRLGFVISNFGPDMRYEGDDLVFNTKVHENQDAQQQDARGQYLTELFQLPLKLQVGIAFDVMNTENQKLVATIDGINPNDYKETFGTGLEYAYNNSYFLRFGYANIFDRGITAGASAQFAQFTDMIVVLNYGLEIHNYLGDLHRIGIDIKY